MRKSENLDSWFILEVSGGSCFTVEDFKTNFVPWIEEEDN